MVTPVERRRQSFANDVMFRDCTAVYTDIKQLFGQIQISAINLGFVVFLPCLQFSIL